MEVAAALERLWPGRGARCEPLTGGITNRNFRVDVDGGSYVLRIGGNDTRLLGIDRAVEHAASLRAAEVGVGPEVVAFIEPEGWLITRFLEASPLPPEELRRPENIARVAAALRRFHGAAPIPGRFDAYAVVDEYRAVAEERGVTLPASFAGLRARWRSGSARRAAHRPRSPATTTSSTPTSSTTARSGSSTGSTPGWATASSTSPTSPSTTSSASTRTACCSPPTSARRPADLASLRLMRFMSDFREAMWGVVQSGISELDFDFDGYAAEHFERMSRAAADQAFEGYLAAFACPPPHLDPPHFMGGRGSSGSDPLRFRVEQRFLELGRTRPPGQGSSVPSPTQVPKISTSTGVPGAQAAGT